MVTCIHLWPCPRSFVPCSFPVLGPEHHNQTAQAPAPEGQWMGWHKELRQEVELLTLGPPVDRGLPAPRTKRRGGKDSSVSLQQGSGGEEDTARWPPAHQGPERVHIQGVGRAPAVQSRSHR